MSVGRRTMSVVACKTETFLKNMLIDIIYVKQKTDICQAFFQYFISHVATA